MNIIDFKLTGNYGFEGTVLKWKSKYQLKGTFKTSYQDYPEDKTVPLYASTVKFNLVDTKGQPYELSESDNQELEEILNDKIDEELESNPNKYKL